MITRIFVFTSNGPDLSQCDAEIAAKLDKAVSEYAHLGKPLAINALNYTRYYRWTTYLQVMVSFEGATT